MQGHTHMLRQLGPNGMSSDESDSEEATRNRAIRREVTNFRVVLPAWRAPELSIWLHVFDSVYIASRRSLGPSRGEFPRQRRHDALSPLIDMDKKPVWHLPRNAYDSTWLAARGDISLQVDAATYNFTHDNRLYR